MNLTDSYPLYKDNIFFFGRTRTVTIYGRYLLFWGLGAGVHTFLFFNHLFRVVSPDNLSPYQGTLFFLGDFSDKLSGNVDPLNNFSQTVCHHKNVTCSFWVVLTDKHPYNYFFKHLQSVFKKKEID